MFGQVEFEKNVVFRMRKVVQGLGLYFAVNKAYNWVYVYLKVACVCESFLDRFTFATFYTINFIPNNLSFIIYFVYFTLLISIVFF